MTEKRRSTVIVSIYEIDNTIRCLDPNKFHGQDKISICMFKICGNSICRQLEIFYKSPFSKICFPWDVKGGTLSKFIKRVTNSA